MADPTAKGGSITLQVPKEFAAQFFTEQMAKPLGKREIFPLRLGDHDLGMWQVVQVASVFRDGGYYVAMATLRDVFP